MCPELIREPTLARMFAEIRIWTCRGIPTLSTRNSARVARPTLQTTNKNASLSFEIEGRMDHEMPFKVMWSWANRSTSIALTALNDRRASRCCWFPNVFTTSEGAFAATNLKLWVLRTLRQTSRNPNTAFGSSHRGRNSKPVGDLAADCENEIASSIKSAIALTARVKLSIAVSFGYGQHNASKRSDFQSGQ